VLKGKRCDAFYACHTNNRAPALEGTHRRGHVHYAATELLAELRARLAAS
jgi:hypothetical protein